MVDQMEGTTASLVDYGLGDSPEEQRRLDAQASLWRDRTFALFEAIGVGPGWRGVDQSLDHLAAAEDFLAAREIVNARLIQADVRASGLPRASFDLAFARLSLRFLDDPAAMVGEMRELVRPGGAVAVHELIDASAFCEPPTPAWDRFQQARRASARINTSLG